MAATEAEIDQSPGGLDKIVERDDEGGGEQADDENMETEGPSLDEGIDHIYKMKQELQAKID